MINDRAAFRQCPVTNITVTSDRCVGGLPSRWHLREAHLRETLLRRPPVTSD